jgi:hypothetical protein
MNQPGAPDSLLQAALKPFQALEAQGIAAQYERSFKLEPGRLITQRYMLGVRTDTTSEAVLIAAARAVGMPQAALDAFAQSLGTASTVLFGFEGVNLPWSSGDAPVFKVYAEYRPRLVDWLPGDAAVELFRGFKWQPDEPHAWIETRYGCRPGLTVEEVRARGAQMLATPALEPVRAAVNAVLERSLATDPGFQPQWLELGESGQPIRAFDLNLYEAGLRVADIARPLSALATRFGIVPDDLERLLAIAGTGLLGHVSAGESRRGAGFLTVYFEPAERAGPGFR